MVHSAGMNVESPVDLTADEGVAHSAGMNMESPVDLTADEGMTHSAGVKVESPVDLTTLVGTLAVPELSAKLFFAVFVGELRAESDVC